MTNTLLINTVLNKPSISLFSKNTSEDRELFLDDGRDQIGKVLPLAIEVVENKNIDELTTIVGPGSFTSIRIGLSLAKGICIAKNIKTKSINAFEYMLHSTSETFRNHKCILCIINAGKKDSYFIQMFSNEKKVITNCYEYSSTEIENLLKQYNDCAILSNTILEEKNIDSTGFLKETLKNTFVFSQDKTNNKNFKGFLKTKDLISTQELKALYIRPHYAIKKT